MREKFMKSASIFSKAIIQPVMFMAVTGIILSVCAILKLEMMPTVSKDIGDFIFNILSGGMIGQLSAIFCVGIATALAKPKYKTDAAILGIITYLAFLYANNAWLTLTNQLAKAGAQGLYGTGQGLVFGIQVTDMGVFLGISLGVLVGFMVNKFGDIKLHKYLSPYSGTKTVYILILFVTILFAIGITYVWPVINNAVETIVKTTTTSGSVGFFFYGFLNRLLLPLGLHHFLWMPIFYTPLGGTAEIAGQAYDGAFNIWLAELGNASQITTMHPSIGYLANFGSISLPIGIAFALWKTARPENRKKVAAILIPTVTTAFLAGVTEPLEFLFLFLSPLLWFAHAIVYGLSMFITNMVGINIQFDTGINMIINSFAFPIRLGHQYLIPIVFLVTAAMEYFVFKTLIVKLNIQTLGREENGSLETDNEIVAGDSEFPSQIKNIVAGLGGVDNIESIINCYTRLRVDVKDETKINMNILKEEVQASGIVDKGKHIQIIIGVGVEEEREKVEAYMEHLKATRV
ncbi:PTS transporter subunit EIIC [Carnobacterium divergens]|uniref:N(Pi)-phosphohistidine--sugar phosphotransferase n=1 Tax=Carnobacterium divergens TaxID=2748 RepID=A0A2R7ZU10_CARDV|nr:PTS transporter subunit EIIC [Carnobacterium divergens]MCO6018781.1 PTS transporter subunit EIIC [Carnobacterium divergens]MPQ22874.1 N(pi)-phosphohistidine--sugar phosphotransferase [Carnobacterium divergens]TFI63897.1 N(pi)-phosphohistidine--sugar phosphotransferase [Carnobacterium divergens]TFI74371.1 N(pi)-phosphohistidine--sugar phosphotransferase [Carnobacterium divergens]TFI78693.1 N(pi)-phosphohistidine--sugar phosphotransferase [Carnobacterium divergens]